MQRSNTKLVIRNVCTITLIVVFIVFLFYTLFYLNKINFTLKNYQTEQWRAETQNFIILDYDFSKIQINKDEEIRLINILPEETEAKKLCFLSYHQKVKVYIGDELAYSYGYDESGKNAYFANHWNIIDIDPSDSNKTITVVMVSPYSAYSGIFNEIYMLNETELSLILNSRNMIPLITICIFMFCQLWFSIVFSKSRSEILSKQFMLFSIILIVASIVILSENGMMETSFGIRNMDYIVYYFAYLLLPIVMANYGFQNNPTRKIKLILGVDLFNFVFFAVVFVISLFKPIHDYLFIAVISSATLLLISTLFCVKYKDHKKYAIINTGYAFFFMGVLIDFILLLFVNVKYVGYFDIIGTVIFIYINLYSFMDSYVQSGSVITKLKYRLQDEKLNTYFIQFEHHYLFNTLITLKELIIAKDTENSVIFIDSLNSCLRECIDSMEIDKMIPIKKEIDFIKKYIYMENYKYQDRIKLLHNMTNEEQLIPAMILQPLVENAIKYGLDNSRNCLNISVESKTSGSNLIITVRNDGKTFDAQSIIDQTKHKGLYNLRQRLNLLVKGVISVQSTALNGTVVEITIPLSNLENGK